MMLGFVNSASGGAFQEVMLMGAKRLLNMEQDVTWLTWNEKSKNRKIDDVQLYQERMRKPLTSVITYMGFLFSM